MSRFGRWSAAVIVVALMLLGLIAIGQPALNRYVQTTSSTQQTGNQPGVVQNEGVANEVVLNEESASTQPVAAEPTRIRATKPAVEIVAPLGRVDRSDQAVEIVGQNELAALTGLTTIIRRPDATTDDGAGQMADSRIIVRDVVAQATIPPVPTTALQVISDTTKGTQTGIPILTATPDIRLTAAAIVPAVASVAPIQRRETAGATPGPFIVPLPSTSTTVTQTVDDPTTSIPTLIPANATRTLTDTVLYAGPSLDSALLRAIPAGTVLVIVARHTTGNWYLLADGSWIAIDVVVNPPHQLPLVFATVTPTPTSSPTATPTDTPIPPTTEPPTLTPTPTSLAAPICSCQSDQYECLGSYFPTHVEAQQCFEYCFRETGMDIHNLDPNLNGRACENLE